jgi:hypothetical protein
VPHLETFNEKVIFLFRDSVLTSLGIPRVQVELDVWKLQFSVFGTQAETVRSLRRSQDRP